MSYLIERALSGICAICFISIRLDLVEWVVPKLKSWDDILY